MFHLFFTLTGLLRGQNAKPSSMEAYPFPDKLMNSFTKAEKLWRGSPLLPRASLRLERSKRTHSPPQPLPPIPATASAVVT